ncbi:hypothetical protein [Leptospira alstonii]|nr:hypothetical protein [Leptospira alstonii]
MPVLTTLLIDASTGILKVIRATSLNLDFANRLESEILNQLNRPFDSNVFDKKFALLYDLYPTTQSMLKDAILS